MSTRRLPRLLIAGSTAAILASACTAADDPAVGVDSVVVTTATPAPDAAFTEVTGTPTGTASDEPVRAESTDGPLAEVCPATIVVQLADLPSVEHGPLVRLLGEEVTIDDASNVVSAPLTRPDGTIEDVVLEIRSGGPAVGFADAVPLMGGDAAITLVEASTADIVRDRDELAVVAVATLSDRSHDIVLWDPASHPDVADLADLNDQGIEIHHSPDEAFVEFLTATGPLADAVLVDAYLGEPARFVAADGRIAQQGDALVDPFLYSTLPQWSRPVEYAFAADSGWESYDDMLAVRADELDQLAPCLGRLVPVLQDAMVAHLTDPASANATIADLRRRFNPLTRVTPELLDAGVAIGLDTEVLGDGENEVIGAVDLDRLQAFLPALADALGVESPAAAEVATTDFVAADRSL